MSPPLRHTFRYVVACVVSSGEEVALAPDDAHHMARVVRRSPGDRVEVIDAAGGLWDARVVSLDPAVVCVGDPREVPPPAPVRLCIGLLDSGRLDLVAEKATELGVRECVVMETSRLRRRPDAAAWSRRAARIERVVAAAARQCGRARLMPVRGLVPFAAIVAETPAGTGFLIDPRGDAPLVGAMRPPGDGAAPVTVAVGPEAGFAPDEVAAARAAGWHICTLGVEVLRAETAAIASATLALAAVGHLGAGA
jgi:16S rRNA (uracil1498-N3)-methyltransferase